MSLKPAFGNPRVPLARTSTVKKPSINESLARPFRSFLKRGIKRAEVA